MANSSYILVDPLTQTQFAIKLIDNGDGTYSMQSGAASGTAGDVANDAVDSGNPIKIGGKAFSPDAMPSAVASGDRVNANFDLYGRLIVYMGTSLDETNDRVRAITEGYKATYRAAVNAHAPAATPTDWFTILGSATKTVKVTQILIAARATAGNQYRVSVIKYSSIYTSGTAATLTGVPLDSGNAGATAVVKTWAAGLPTPGTAVGKLHDSSIPVGVLGTPIYDNRGLWVFGNANGQLATLRGAGEYLALNSNAVALPSGVVFDVTVEWTEE